MGFYGLWDVTTKNHIGEFDDEDEALTVIKDTIACYGVDVVEDIVLMHEDDGEVILVAVRDTLAERALQSRLATA